MLKTTRLLNKPAPNKNDGSRSAFSKNDNSRPIFGKNDGNGKVNLVLMVMLYSTLRSEENQKVKNCLSPKNRLSQEKICQKVGIHLILALQKPDQWLSLPIITPKMLALATCLSSSIADIILGFFTKKNLIPAHSQKLRKNYLSSSKVWWPLINRTFIMLKNFRNKPTIRKSSPKAMHQARKSG